MAAAAASSSRKLRSACVDAHRQIVRDRRGVVDLELLKGVELSWRSHDGDSVKVLLPLLLTHSSSSSGNFGPPMDGSDDAPISCQGLHRGQPLFAASVTTSLMVFLPVASSLFLNPSLSHFVGQMSSSTPEVLLLDSFRAQ